jgi:hypothetical protein
MKLGIGLKSIRSGRKNSIKKVNSENFFVNKIDVESNVIHIPFSKICPREYMKINNKERTVLMKALERGDNEVVEPLKDDNKTMAIIVDLYNKKLVYIDHEQDKLFVNEKALAILN